MLERIDTKLVEQETLVVGTGTDLMEEINGCLSEAQLKEKEIELPTLNTQWYVERFSVEQGRDISGIATRYFPQINIVYIPLLDRNGDQTGTIMVGPSTEDLHWKQLPSTKKSPEISGDNCAF